MKIISKIFHRLFKGRTRTSVQDKPGAPDTPDASDTITVRFKYIGHSKPMSPASTWGEVRRTKKRGKKGGILLERNISKLKVKKV